MSISAVAAALPWQSSNPSTAASTTQTASAFQTMLLQWQQNSSSTQSTQATQATQASQTQPDQQATNGVQQHHHHHHHHGVQSDGDGQSTGPIQTALSSLADDIAGALQTAGPSASGTAASNTGTTASGTANNGATAIQAAANTLTTDIAQALQAYGTSNQAGTTAAGVVL